MEAKNENMLTLDECALIDTEFSKACSLPPKCYTDPVFYEWEDENIFRREWLCVGREEQIPKIGDYFTIDLLNEPLVVVRDENQQINVLSRICRHRWMPVVSEGCGNQQSFRCPYHAWNYSLTGQLIQAPSMEKTQFDKANCRLPSLKTEIWQGFIFVNFSGNAVPLNIQLSSLSKKLEGYQLANMRCIEPVIYHSDWNWKVMVENASEVYHLGLHRDVLCSMLPIKDSIIDDNDGPYTFYRIPNIDRKPMQTTFEPVSTLNEIQRSEFVLCSIFPCHLMVINPDQMTWIQILPQSFNKHTLRFFLSFQKNAFDDPAFKQKCQQSKWFLDQIHQQDIFACQQVQIGLSSKLATPTPFSYLEKSIWQFHRWIANRYKLSLNSKDL